MEGARACGEIPAQRGVSHFEPRSDHLLNSFLSLSDQILLEISKYPTQNKYPRSTAELLKITSFFSLCHTAYTGGWLPQPADSHLHC